MTGWALCVFGFTVLGWKFCCVLLGEVNHTKRRKEEKKKMPAENCQRRSAHSELINQGEVYVLLFCFFACVSQTCKEKKKRRQEVAFGGWPLNGCAYRRAVDSASELLKTRWYFPRSVATFPRHLKWTLPGWKGRWIVLGGVFRTLTRKFIRTWRSPAQKSSVLAVNFVAEMKSPPSRE